MIPNILISINQKGSSLSLPAYGRVGQEQHSLAAYFAKRNTKFGGGKARAGKNSFPPTQYERKSLLGFCFPVECREVVRHFTPTPCHPPLAEKTHRGLFRATSVQWL